MYMIILIVFGIWIESSIWTMIVINWW